MSKYDFRILQHSKHLRFLCFVLFGALYSFQVNAQAANAGDVFGYVYYKTSGASTTVESGGSSSTAIRDMGWGGYGTSGPDPVYKGSPTIRNPSGNPLVVDVATKVPIGKVAKIIGGALGIAGAIQTASALYELCQEMDFGCRKDEGGPLVITRTTSGCSAGPIQDYMGLCGSGEIPTLQPYRTGPDLGSACYVKVYCPPNNALVNQFAGGVSGQPEQVPSNPQELQDAIASKAGWPSSTSLHRALEESARATGQRIPLETPTVTGPPTSVGTKTVAVNPTAKTTTTTTTNHNHIYNDNRVTTSTVTGVSVTNNTTGATTTTTTTTEPIQEPGECEKNPQALNCADLDTPEGEIPRVEKLITFNPENLGFAGGSCPANVVQNLAGKPVTIVNWAENCSYITTYAKPTILVLATFSALMIIFVGGRPE